MPESTVGAESEEWLCPTASTSGDCGDRGGSEGRGQAGGAGVRQVGMEEFIGNRSVREQARAALEQRQRQESARRAEQEQERRAARRSQFRAQFASLFGMREVYTGSFPVPEQGDRLTVQGYEFSLPEEGDASRLSVAIVCDECGQRFERAEVGSLADVGELDVEYTAHRQYVHGLAE